MLAGKTICVTGAAHGLGAAYARHLADHGARVICADIDADGAEAMAEKIGPAARAIAVDVADWGSGDRLVAAARAFGGRIDGLVNNAGVLTPARLEDVTEADVDRMLAINLKGAFGIGRAAILAMRAQGGAGSVVNVASGSLAGDIALSVYAATKGGVASMTYTWAMECRGSGIRVNAVSPLAETGMARANIAFLAEQSASKEVGYHTLPAAESNAPLVSWLMSDRAKAINGQIIRIAGRELALMSHPQIARPILEGDWSVETIDRAFSDHLAGRLAPLGLSRMPEPGTPQDR